jgi:UDP-N-acetylmuramoyl-L-alanyl-D-glutamate--2,6-diaminopimelate ligase
MSNTPYKQTGTRAFSFGAFARKCYHFIFPFVAATLYGFPSKKLLVIGVTGTKGKSSVIEMLNAIFEEAGYTTALVSSIRVKVGSTSKPNSTAMSMPGRFFLQSFLNRAANHKCQVAIIEMTSQGAEQYRHRAIDMDALIFTNLAPEHVESHGSYEAYANAKFEIAKQLARSKKHPRFVVANADDKESPRYLGLDIEHRIPFSLSAAQPHHADDHGGFFTFDNTRIEVKIPGEFSLKNALAATVLARALDIKTPVIAAALGKLTVIPGRTESIEEGQNFTAVVDYAHTPDSLEELFKAYGSKRKICIIGSTGGGRDMWKRPVMGRIADTYCDHVIITNEDPFDEDPRSIADSIAHGMKRTPEIILDRREAIARALSLATDSNDAVLVIGKGTDPYLRGAHGEKKPWSDAQVVREELAKLLKKHV